MQLTLVFYFALQLNGVVPHDNLVLIKMRPDEHGRFGFNVKVGIEIALCLSPL